MMATVRASSHQDCHLACVALARVKVMTGDWYTVDAKPFTAQ